MKPKFRSASRFSSLTTGIFAGVLASSSLNAATIYWDGISSSWGTVANWSTASGSATPNPAAVPGALDDAIFNITTVNGAETITLDANRLAKSLTFNNTGTTALTGGGTARTLTLGGDGITIATGAGAVTLGTGVVGQNVLISLAGAQTWTNNSANSFTINNTAASFTRTSGSTLVFNKVGAGDFLMSTTVLPNVNGIVGPWAFFGTGANMKYAVNNAGTIGGLTGSAAADAEAFVSATANYDFSNTGTTTLTTNRTANTIRYTGTGNTIDLGASGANTLTLNGILATGASGTLTLDRTGGTGTVVIGTTNELVIAGQQAVTINAPISNNSGALTYSGTNTLTLGGNNTFRGGVNISNGTVLLANAGALNSAATFENAVNFGASTSGTLALNGNSVVISNLNGSLGGTVIQNANGSAVSAATLTVGNASNLTGTFAGIIQDGTGGGALTLAKSGTGTLTLNGAISTTGGIVVNAGTLNLGTRVSNVTNTFTGGITLNGGTLTPMNASFANSVLIVNGNSTLNVGQENVVNVVTASGVTLSAGVLTIVANTKTFTSTGAVTGGGGIILGQSGGGATNVNFNSTANTFTGAISYTTIAQSGNLTVNSFVDSATFGAGNITFGAAAASIAHNFNYGTGAITGVLLDNRQFEIAGSTNANLPTINNNSSQALTIGSALLASGTGTRTLTLGGTGIGISTFGGVIDKGNLTTLSLTKAGSGTWVLSGANTYDGATTVSAGTLAGIGANAFGSTSGISIAAASTATLSLRGNTSTNFVRASDSVAYSVTTTANGATINVDQATVAGTGPKTMGIGTLQINTAIINGTNFTGANNTSLSIGAVTTGNSVSGTETIQNDISGGGSLTMASIAVNRTTAPTLAFAGNGDTTVTGAITQVATTALTKNGNGILTLGGTNGYTGATTVNAGTLLINGSTSSTSAFTVNAGTLGGTGTIGGSVSVVSGATLSPGASIQSLATGALTMASSSTFAYEVANNSSTGADLLGVNGALTLTSVNLSLDSASLLALAGGSWTVGNKLTLISYIAGGSEITSGFAGYADNTNYNFGSNVWTFDYNDLVAGGNYATDAVAASQNRFVTLTAFTVVPEPNTALLGALGLLALLRRRR